MSNSQEMNDAEIIGSKGGGGGGGNEAANTLRSSAVAQVVEIISEGPIVGLMGGAKGIFLNDTPLQNSDDDTFNFQRVVWDFRAGLEDQKHMEIFGIGTETSVAAPLVKDVPVTRTVVSSSIDSARVTLLLPNGLVKYEDNGDSVGTSVNLLIQVKPLAGGTWVTQVNATIDGKTTAPYERQYAVRRPEGPESAWQIRVTRVTPDAADSKIRNDTSWNRFTNVEETREQYNNTALVGLKADAEAFGNAYPQRAYLVKGLIISVPSNYDPDTRVYSGIWDGTFKQAWTDNPAWVLYALLTNTRWGLGEFVTPDFIDVYSFYDAAVYNDQPVTYTKNGVSTSEPRFTFNATLSNRTDALKLLQLVAGMQNSVLFYQGGLLRLSQDRPVSPVMQFTNSNVEEGKFTYSTSSVYTRTTSVNVTFSDRAQNYLPSVCTEFNQAGIDRYGLNSADLEAVGATTEAQAVRAARWVLDTALNQTKICKFAASYDAFGLRIGDVVQVYDENFANKAGEGRIVSYTGSTITLDKPIVISGSPTITVYDNNFVKQQRTVTSPPGTHTIITISGSLTNLPEQAVFILQTNIGAQSFKIMNMSEGEKNKVDITAVQYDINKFARVEGGIIVNTLPSTQASDNVIGDVTNIEFKETAPVTSDGIKRTLLVSWLPPALGVVASYNMRWRQGLGTWVFVEGISAPAFEITDLAEGAVEVIIYAKNIREKISRGVTATYTVNLSTADGSPLKPVTNLQIKGGGTTFLGRDATFEWVNPLNQENVLAQLKGFELQMLDPTTDALVGNAIVGAVVPGAKGSYLLDFAQNSQTVGGPFRTFKIKVYAIDTNNKRSLPTTATFTNPAPAALTNFIALDGIGDVKLSWNQPPDLDYVGVVVWAGTTAGFTPSSSNIAFNTTSTFMNFTPAALDTLWYFKAAAYDDFGFNPNGSDLNITSRSATARNNSVGVPGGTTFPAAPSDGDSFFRTDLDVLFFYNAANSRWEQAGIRKGATNPASGNIDGDIFYNTSDKKLYRFNGSAWTAAVPTVDLTGQIQTNQIIDNGITAIKLGTNAVTAGAIAANAVTSTKIADDSITTPKILAGAITAAKIQANSLTANEIASNAITVNELAANSVITEKMAANSINGDRISANTLSADKIIANSITATQIATNAITSDKILANNITAIKMAADSVSTTALQASAVTAGKISAFAVEAGKIAANAVTANTIAANAVIASKIAADSIAANHIQVNAVGTLKIGPNEVTIPVGNFTRDARYMNSLFEGIASVSININTPNAGVIVSFTGVFKPGVKKINRGGGVIENVGIIPFGITIQRWINGVTVPITSYINVGQSWYGDRETFSTTFFDALPGTPGTVVYSAIVNVSELLTGMAAPYNNSERPFIESFGMTAIGAKR